MTSFDVGPLVLGANTFGWTATRDEAFAVLDAFLAAGGRMIDTSDSYGKGASEEILGEWMTSRNARDSVLVATKVSQLETRPGLSAANIAAAAEDSLRRLNTDRIDLYYAHRDDPEVEQEESFGAFHELVQTGKVRRVGVSNFSPERLQSAVAVIVANGLTPITASQDHYNLVERALESTLLPVLREHGIVEHPYFSLASGYLTGKYRPGVEVDSARARLVQRYADSDPGSAILSVLDEVASERGVSQSAVALSWLRQQPGVGAPIASARVVEQLPALVESFDLELSAEELGRLSATSA